jgi:hypothetical protein
MSAGVLDAGAPPDASLGDDCSSAPVTTAPAQWVRPSNCAGIGNSCSQGCGSGICQVVGYVCIPSTSACGPYCVPSVCMSFDEASCLCTSDAGVAFPACECGPAALAGLCGMDGDPCGPTTCCACEGLKCVAGADSGSVCRQHCSRNADCSTGCCDSSAGVCQDSLYCSCVDAGAACVSGGPFCCQGSTCVPSAADGGGAATCSLNCNTPSDCAPACCLQPSPGQTQRVCGPCH